MSSLAEKTLGMLQARLAPCLAVPECVDRYDYRSYYSMLIANSMAFLLHLSWIFLFFALGFPTLAYINIVCLLIWILNIAILRHRGAVLTAVVIGSAEVVTHQFLTIYYLGWGYGFQYYLLVVVAFAFMMNFKSMLIPGLMFVICLALFLGFYYEVQYWRPQLYGLPHVELGDHVREAFFMTNVTSAFAIIAMMSYVYSEAARNAEAALALEQEKSDRLLLNILPASIAQRLKEDSSVIADHFESATVLFSDIVGFTELSEKSTPTELVNCLNRLFCAFDDLAERYDLEKIKTIGDAYMVAGGFPEQREGHTEDMARMALQMLDAVADCNADSGQSLELRIGIHTGPAVAGVIGIKKFAYDVWGDTVNTASRMESSGLPGRIQLSEQAAEAVNGEFNIVERGLVAVKGKGEMRTFWLEGRRT